MTQQHIKHNYQYVKDYIESFGYKLLSKEYINNHTKLKLKCLEGHEYEARFKNFKNLNHRCPYCAGQVITYNDVKNYIESFNYKLLSKKYSGAHSILEIECPEGHIYKVSFSSFKNQHYRCPTCNQEETDSKGVRQILKYLEENDIQFEREYTFQDCKGKVQKLPFDFAVFKNNELHGLIEYQGKQHFIDNGIWQYDELIKNDQIKANYCNTNDINFIAIPYSNIDIHKDLNTFME